MVKLKFKWGIQIKVVTNWKNAVEFVKKPHNSKEQTKEKQVTFKATNFKSFLLLDGINKSNKIPRIGNIKFTINIFLMDNIKVYIFITLKFKYFKKIEYI